MLIYSQEHYKACITYGQALPMHLKANFSQSAKSYHGDIHLNGAKNLQCELLINGLVDLKNGKPIVKPH